MVRWQTAPNITGADVLKNMQQGNYNEVIINTKSIDDLLPSAVEAYALSESHGPERPARQRRLSFLRQYKLDAATHPLLRMDPQVRKALARR